MEKIIAITPAHVCDPQVAIAACRAGERGILDLGFLDDPAAISAAVAKLVHYAGKTGRWGIRWETLGVATRSPARLADLLSERVPVVVLGGITTDDLAEAKLEAVRVADQVFLEVHDLETAQAAEKAGYDGLIVKGHEAGGCVGSQSSFILLQALNKKLQIPYWIQGGIGLHTAAAAILAGATGVVLCEQFWLTEESPFSPEQKNFWKHLDGSETICVGRDDAFFRCYSRRGRSKLDEYERALADGGQSEDIINQWLLNADREFFIPCGQDIGLASFFSKKFITAGSVVSAIRQGVPEHLITASNHHSLSAKSELAKAHGTRYPIVQGPMANVSDVVPFGKAVANEGGLPFYALSALTGEKIQCVLERAQTEMGSLNWGIGVLGFLPSRLHQEQFDVIKKFKPPFAIIAGGNPLQAAKYEKAGVSTYLHVPSPGLLSSFIKGGVKKMIFEGRECGGHVGPLASFIHWELAINRLLEEKPSDAKDFQILFAGGIHDSLSAAMVQAIAAPLTDLGMKIGIVMGSAYLFCDEAVQHGAITREYQRQVMACKSTVLVETGVGYAFSSIKSPFIEKFLEKKQKLINSGKSYSEIRHELETMNLGRLKLAAKGVSSLFEESPDNDYVKHVLVKEVNVDEETQKNEGLYVIGQLARLRCESISIGDLHADVSIKSLDYLKKTPSSTKNKVLEPSLEQDIAIIGMACLLPGAADVRTFWENIINRVNSIREVKDGRWRSGDFFDQDRRAPDKSYSKWGGFLDDLQFDPTKYGIPPSSVKSIEPVQLLALEVARRALEDAGYHSASFPRDRTTVVFGIGGIHDLGIDYAFRTMLSHYLPRVPGLSMENRQHIIEFFREELPKWNEDTFPGVLDNVVSGRVANRFDFQGTNFTVDAACASSMAALDVGINRLRSGGADVALVGAVDGTNNIVSYIAFSKVQALSPQSNCRPLDDSADGIIIGEGVAVLVLKRLSDAERDGDRIYTVIKGIGSSSDGRNRSLTAPHPDGQVLAVSRAYEDAGIEPSMVELVEAHGTGTAVGDKAEIESLNVAFGEARTDRQYCAIGSVKSMIGHTKCAAGLASVIKSVLALKHRILPPTIGVEVPNTFIDFSQTPFYINTKARPWITNRDRSPRRCGVSAFGFGGTNFHVVLEEYTKNYRSCDKLDLNPRGAEIFVIQRGERSQVVKAVKQLERGLEYPGHIDLTQLAYSVHLEESKHQPDRKGRTCRLAVVASSAFDLKQKLQMLRRELQEKTAINNPIGVYYGEADGALGRVCFLFPGQGSQRVNMLGDVVMSIPEVADIFEQADVLLKNRLPKRLSSYIYPLSVFSDQERDRQKDELDATQIAQPALAVVDLSALKVLEYFGLKPDFVAGHSYGEYVALCAAGTLNEEDLIRLSEFRGRIVTKTSENNPGGMAVVNADEAKVWSVIKRLALSVIPANINSSEQTIVAGSVKGIEQAIIAFNHEKLMSKKIPVTAAYHTPAMASAGDALREKLQGLELRKPKCKVYSNTLGDVYPDDPEAIRELLGRHVSEPVLFLKQVNKMYQDGARVFIEAGPGRVLGNLIDGILGERAHKTMHLDVEGRPGWIQLAHLLAQAMITGLPVDLNRWFEGRCLSEIGVKDVVEEALAKSNPGPMIFRVNGGKSTPWNVRPVNIAATRKPKTDVGAVKELSEQIVTPARGRTGEPLIEKAQNQIEQNRRKRMAPNDGFVQNTEKQQTMLKGREFDSVHSQVQENISKCLELQRGQLQVIQRFLDIQERLLNGRQHDDSLTFHPPVAQWNTIALEHAIDEDKTKVQATTELSTYATAAAPLQTHTVPPAPALPKLEIISCTGPTDSTSTLQGKAGAPLNKAEAGPKSAAPSMETGGVKGPATVEQFRADLLRLVSERTGYPEDMLDLDLDMEAELGIDSIKRVEIFNELNEYHDLLEGKEDEYVLEELAGLKTLQRVVDWYQTNLTRALEEGSRGLKKA